MGSDQPAGAARGGKRSRLRVGVALLGAAAALTVAMAAEGIEPGTGRRPGAGQGPAAVSVWIAAGRPAAPVPRGFLGLSFELSTARQIGSYADTGNLAALLRSLGPGVLRLGGASADTRVAWTDAHTPRPAWASAVLTVGDLRRLHRLALDSGWRVLLTLGLAHYDPHAAAREAAAARAVLGRWLAGIEVGNEPDSYGRHNLRSLPWTPRRYERQVSTYRRAIAHLAPGISLAGPGVSGSSAFVRWGAAEARRQRPALLTGHHYPLRCDSAPAPSIEALLSEHTRQREGVSLARFLSVSRANATRFRVDETNTVSCGGRTGVSDTFASALWAVSYITQTMVAGASGINLQGNPARCTGYSPVCATSPKRLAQGMLHAQPEWYALLLTSALVGDRPLRTRMVSQAHPNVVVSALRAHDGGLRVVVVEDDPPSASGVALRVHVGARARTATVLALSAPSPQARAGVMLGGRAVAGDGSWRAPRPRPVSVRGGVVELTVAPSSAALVSVAPSARGGG
jgi:hypothetical protein